jgi:hypothetical protein
MTDLASSTATVSNINAATCQEVGNILWRPAPYGDFEAFHNTIPIRIAHTGIPRAGASNDILDVIMGTPEQSKDYLMGLLTASIIILSFFIAWIALLIVLKCCFGTAKVGWLSGRRQPLPRKPKLTFENQEDLVFENYDYGDKVDEYAQVGAPQPPQLLPMEQDNMQQQQHQNPQDDLEIVLPKDDVQSPIDEQDDAAVSAVVASTAKADSTSDSHCPKEPTSPQTIEGWNELYHRKMKQQLWLKGIVIVACVFVICMAITMGVNGVQALRGSVYYGRNSLNYAQRLVNAAAETVAGLTLTLQSFQADMQVLLSGTNAVCPNVRPFLCEKLSNVATCNTTGVFGNTNAGQRLGETFQQLVQIFYGDWAIVSKLQDFEQDLLDMSGTASSAEYQISTFQWIFYVAVIFNVMVGLLALAMIVFLLLPSTLRGWCVRCMHHRFLFPTFIVLVLFSFIFAIAFLIVSLVSSDVYVHTGKRTLSKNVP